MIVFDLLCREGGHRFEGWFSSLQAFDEQRGRGLLSCPHCGSETVEKAIQAPHVGRKGNQGPAKPRPADTRPVEAVAPGPVSASAATGNPAPVAATPMAPEAVEILHKLAKLQSELVSRSRNVGDRFAENARAMHYGESEPEAIYGEASAKDVRDLLDEGVSVLPLPFPVVAPEDTN